MKPRTLERLELLAAEREAQLREAVRRHQATLKQNEVNREVLGSYRDRLATSWRDGSVVPAGQARRAGQFAEASFGAEAQIVEALELAAEQLALAMDGLADIQSHRRELREAIAQAERKARMAAELAIEQDRPWRSFNRMQGAA